MYTLIMHEEQQEYKNQQEIVFLIIPLIRRTFILEQFLQKPVLNVTLADHLTSSEL